VLSGAVAQSFSDDSGIRYVCPVLWITLCFPIMGHVLQHLQYLCECHAGASSLGLASISFWSRSDRLLYCAIRVDHKQDWSRSWS